MQREEEREIALKEGEAKGFSEGAYQKAIETAKLMRRENCPTDFIQRITGLTEAEIKKL